MNAMKSLGKRQERHVPHDPNPLSEDGAAFTGQKSPAAAETSILAKVGTIFHQIDRPDSQLSSGVLVLFKDIFE